MIAYKRSLMETKSKADTFIGFAMRAGKYKIGAGAVGTLKKAHVIIVCETAAENSVKEALKLARRLHAKLFKTNGIKLEDITHRENAKIMALTDHALSKAFCENAENEFIEIEQENNNG